MPSSDDPSSDYDYDDYSVDKESVRAGNRKDNQNDLAVANALRAAVGEAERAKKRRPLPKLDFERYIVGLCPLF